MEEEAKPIRQPQRRLNPHLQEVVRTEVLKLLQAGIIYPISDSPWVSPTQVVQKKSGIIVVQNEKGEEIAIRLTSGAEESLWPSFLLFWTGTQGIVLGHIISEKGIEVDKAKVELIAKIAIPNHCKRRSFIIVFTDHSALKYLLTKQDAKQVPSEWKAQDRKHLFTKIHAYYWEEPFLFKYCVDQIIRKCVPEEEQQGILSHHHKNACGGHFASQKTAMKVLQSGFYLAIAFQRLPHHV
ncbi:hypothetical protein CK203_027933 [Vitis vinifera]|uniref:Reverse transcriptase RNase H-like domain-containing protein n=1 Tax=Vitis vinifera TaxID=29760 RepID=A0A438J3F3_VITVI|nr:hypothetical protein CK203_027933 [Vitis vinifera]